MSKKTDLRVLRTKKSIRRAFLYLLKIKNYNKITIQDIANEAMINRNTFYLHYLDKDDLLDNISSECFSRLKENMNSSNIKTIEDLDYKQFYLITKRVFEVIEQDFDFYKAILGDDSLPYLTYKFSNVIKNHMGTEFKQNTAEAKDFKVLYTEYMASGLIGIIRYWINNKNEYSIDEVCKIVIDIYSNDMLQLLKNIKSQ